MKQLEDAIEKLTDSNSSLVDALLKTKVILHKVGRKDLESWVNMELNGYPEDAELPDYRKMTGVVKANISNFAHSRNNVELPTMQLDDEVRQIFQNVQERSSISSIVEYEHMKDKKLGKPLAPELGTLFNDVLSGGSSIQSIWIDIGVGEMTAIITKIRSKLLDFLLELQDKVEPDMTKEQLEAAAGQVSAESLFNNAQFGNNTTILVGQGTQNVVNYTVVKGDFDSLEAALKEHQVQDADIKELRAAIRADPECDISSGQFGPAVKQWIVGMTGKALDQVWQIEIGVASSLLATLIGNYYGL